MALDQINSKEDFINISRYIFHLLLFKSDGKTSVLLNNEDLGRSGTILKLNLFLVRLLLWCHTLISCISREWVVHLASNVLHANCNLFRYINANQVILNLFSFLQKCLHGFVSLEILFEKRQ